jgi:hypothetical protein
MMHGCHNCVNRHLDVVRANIKSRVNNPFAHISGPNPESIKSSLPIVFLLLLHIEKMTKSAEKLVGKKVAIVGGSAG